MSKTALITGISGQDGAYLAAFLLEKGYRVAGTVRRSGSTDLWRLRSLGCESSVELVDLELSESSNVEALVRIVAPDEIYNLAALSSVGASFGMPIFPADVNALGALRMLEALRRHRPIAKFYQASTSEMFGRVDVSPQDETTPFHPRSPYAVSKVFAHWTTVNYREAWDLFAVSGILFNHESPLRSREFVTRKITAAVAERAAGGADTLKLGNLGVRRDWGFAGDYVRAMWSMLQATQPSDYVIASGESHTVREFVTLAFQVAGIDLEWHGSGAAETGRDARSGELLVEVCPTLFRPAEVEALTGNPARARAELGFEALVTFPQLVEMMVEHDLRARFAAPVGSARPSTGGMSTIAGRTDRARRGRTA